MEPLNIYYTVTNGGDGSYGVQFFFEQESIDILTDKLPEHYPAESDGVLSVTGGLMGMQIYTPADVERILADYSWDIEEDDLLCPLP